MKPIICCVTENRPSWFTKVLNLVLSVRAFGGAASDAEIVVCVVETCDPGFRSSLQRLGAQVRVVQPVDDVIRYANKLRMFELQDIDYDVLLALDCDTIVVGDPSPFLNGDALRLKPVDRNYLSDDQWTRVYRAAGLGMPAKTYLSTSDGDQIPPYFNSGVVIVPARDAARLADLWRRYVFEIKDVYERDRDIAVWRRFNDQFALSCAVLEGGFGVDPLPISMNFPTHVRIHPSMMGSLSEVAIIHYHSDLDEDGFVLASRFGGLNEHIDRFNRERSETLGIPYAGLHAPPMMVRVRRQLSDQRWFNSQPVERAKQDIQRLLVAAGWRT